MVLPLWSKCNVPVPLNPDPVTPVWWNPGIYIKWNDTQLMNQYTTVKNEIALSSMDALQGVKFAILWVGMRQTPRLGISHRSGVSLMTLQQ